jgi:hypothetical protein
MAGEESGFLDGRIDSMPAISMRQRNGPERFGPERAPSDL